MIKKISLILFISLFYPLFSYDSVKLTFAGDLMAHDINFKTKPLSDIYKGVSDILTSDDLSFVNLEFPIDETRAQSSYPSFNVHPSYVESAIKNGFDVFALGNNHTNDFGYDSLIKTAYNMSQFKRMYPISFSGLFGESQDSFVVETIQIKELTIGYLSVTQFSNNFWDKRGASKVYTVDFLNSESVETLVKYIEVESEKYDCFILSYHGGVEYSQNPSIKRKEFFKRLVDSGVDILWGHHPHVLQPWELISSESGDKLILYSMGNFLSGQLAIVDPNNHDINFAATGISSLFNAEISLENGVLRIQNTAPRMIANIRNENNYFVAVNKDEALNYPMSDDWKKFYEKMFPLAEVRIRKDSTN